MSESRPHPNLVLTAEGAVWELRIEREDALGALNADIMDALDTLAGELQGTADCRCLILTGTGKGFVAGADISGYHNVSQSEFDAFQKKSRNTFDRIAALPQATICAVNGYALGGGFELALCCDIILVSDRARLGLPEIKLGLLPGGGGTQRLSRLIGTMRARELILSGRFMDAAEAVRIGAALKSLPADELLPYAREMAAGFASRAPLPLAEGKRLINQGIGMALEDALTLEQRVLGGLFATADGREGIAAFLEKRQPAFKGQ